MSELLKGWKDIAKHLGVTPKTAKLYHKKGGMPVLRLPNNRPVSYPDMIKNWLIESNSGTSYKLPT